MRSVEFLIHYQCECGWSWTTGDRFPLDNWTCRQCGKTNIETDTTMHLNLMSDEERSQFADKLRIWLSRISENGESYVGYATYERGENQVIFMNDALIKEAGMKPPDVGSVWRNKKKGTLYRVWAIAVDDSGDRFVVYQESDALPSHFIYVRHSETENFGSYNGEKIYWLSFRNLPADETICPWARPLEMWHEKFERRSAPEHPPATPRELRTNSRNIY